MILRSLNRKIFTLLFFQLSSLSPFWSYAQSPCIPITLKCENLVNPLGIDAPEPRLPWRLEGKRNDAIQTAYQLFVGTDSLAVSKANGMMWQTAKLNLPVQTIKYNGKTLLP